MAILGYLKQGEGIENNTPPLCFLGRRNAVISVANILKLSHIKSDL